MHKYTINYKLFLFAIISFFSVYNVFAIDNIDTNKIKELILERKNLRKYKKENTHIIAIFPLKKHTPSKIVYSYSKEYVFLVSFNGELQLYRNGAIDSNYVIPLYLDCRKRETEAIQKINFDSNMYFCYLLDEEKFDSYIKLSYKDSENYYVVTSENDSILIDICSGEKRNINSIILDKYGSMQKYKELLQQDEKEAAIWLEVPKTIEQAYEFIRKDYAIYYDCYSQDTVAAALMLIEDISKAANLDSMQIILLKQKILTAIHLINNPNMRYKNQKLSIAGKPTKGSDGIYLGQYIREYDFYSIIESILTKQQMAVYLEHYNKQKTIREHVKSDISAMVTNLRGERSHQWSYIQDYKDEYYKDPCDFLRQEVYKK